MSSTTFSALSGRQRALLVLVAVLPLAIVIAARQLGVMALLKLAVAGVIGAGMLVVVFARPRWGIYFMAFYIFSGLNFYIPGVLAIAVMATVGLAALIELMSEGGEWGADPLYWGAIAVLLLLTLQSMMVAHYPELTLARMVRAVKALLLATLTLYYIRSLGDLRRLTATMFAGAVATVVIGAAALQLGMYNEGNVIRGVNVFRFSGLLDDPNDAAALMCAAIPMGIFFVRHEQRRWARVLALLGVVALVVGVFSTFSRAAIFSFAAVVLAIIAREVRSRGGWFAVIALIGVGLLLAPGYYWARLANLQEVVAGNINQDFSVMLRFEAMKAAWGLFLDNPWFGIGLGNFIARGAPDVVRRIAVHNAYLEILVSLGVFGLLAYLTVFAAGLRHSIIGARDAALSPEMRSLCFYLGVSIVAMMISAVFLSMMFKYQLWMPLAAVLALGNVRRSRAA